MYDTTRTIGILTEIAAERLRQEEAYVGINDILLDGTGPNVTWLDTAHPWDPVYPDQPADVIQRALRQDYEYYEKDHGHPTWMHILREEVAEVFQESDQGRLREELIQVAAVAASWIERIDKRAAGEA